MVVLKRMLEYDLDGYSPQGIAWWRPYGRLTKPLLPSCMSTFESYLSSLGSHKRLAKDWHQGNRIRIRNPAFVAFQGHVVQPDRGWSELLGQRRSPQELFKQSGKLNAIALRLKPTSETLHADTLYRMCF